MLEPDLEALEADVVHSIATGDTSRLNFIGHGEISLVLGWPPTHPEVVCKRLPPFPDAASYQSYRDVVLRYIDELRDRGVRVIDTEVRHLVRDDERFVGFHVQPLLPADRLGTEVLRHGDSEEGESLLDAVTETVVRATDDRLGIDAQLSNWVWLDAEPWQIDLTTPLVLDDDRQPGFDLTPFLAPLPAVARPIVRREMAKLMQRWTTARGALVDLAANLLKEELDDWLASALRTINARVSPPITEAEVKRVHLEDRRLWPLLFHLEHLNRWWQRRLRRREFDFLLPERTTYEEHRRRGRLALGRRNTPR